MPEKINIFKLPGFLKNMNSIDAEESLNEDQTTDYVDKNELILDESLFEAHDFNRMMTGNKPYFVSGRKAGYLKQEAELLLRLYEACYNPGNAYDRVYTHRGIIVGRAPSYARLGGDEFKGVWGSTLAGDVYRKSDPSNGSSYFKDYERLNLAYETPSGYIVPGPNLVDWVEGNLSIAQPNGVSYPSGVDIRNYSRSFGKLTPTVYNTSPSTTSNSTTTTANTYSAPSTSTYSSNDVDDTTSDISDTEIETNVEPEVEDNIDVTPEEDSTPDTSAPARKINRDRFKRRTKTESIDDSYTAESASDYLEEQDRQFIEKVKKEYRSWRGLSEDADISDQYNDDDFSSLCCCKRYPYRQTRNKIWGEFKEQ